MEGEQEAIAVANRVGSSRISETLSTFHDSSLAFFRRSRTAFSAFALLYFCEKLRAFSSSSGTPSRMLEAEEVRAGRYSPSLESELDAAMTDLCDRDDMDCRARRLLLADCARD